MHLRSMRGLNNEEKKTKAKDGKEKLKQLQHFLEEE